MCSSFLLASTFFLLSCARFLLYFSVSEQRSTGSGEVGALERRAAVPQIEKETASEKRPYEPMAIQNVYCGYSMERKQINLGPALVVTFAAETLCAGPT